MQVAEWMLEELKREGELYQENAVQSIEEKFGKPFTYLNENGNPAIRKDVLAAFSKLYRDFADWEREDPRWRMHEPGTAKP